MRALLFAIVAFAVSVHALLAQTLTDSSLAVAPYRTGFASPTGFAFMPNGELLVLEKATGRVQYVNSAGTKVQALDLNVNSFDERGLLGIALDPNFASNGFTYIYYSVNPSTDSTTEPGWTENRLSRFTWNGSTLGSESVMLSFPRDAAQNNGPNHDGGPLMFGADGKLYGMTGDLNRSRVEQNQGTESSSSGVGGMYRLNTDGSIPTAPGDPPNPFATHSNTALHKWFAYGIRNSFGIARDPVTDAIWDTENGPTSYDEINVVQAGFNSGWSDIMGPDSRDPQGVSDLVMLPGAHYSDPEFSTFNPIGITDLEFLANFNYDWRYENAVIFGGSNGTNAGRLHILRLNENRDAFDLSGDLADGVADNTTELATITFGSGFGVATDIQVGPDNAIYVLSIGGTLYRIANNATFLLADMNGDGVVNNFDIQPFETALTNADQYRTNFPAVVNYKLRGDINDDGVFNNFDIQPFEQLLTSQLAAVPEPPAWLLAVLGGGAIVAMALRARRCRPGAI